MLGGRRVLTEDYAQISGTTLRFPRSPGTHIVGPWVINTINVYRDLGAGTQYIGNWASRGS